MGIMGMGLTVTPGLTLFGMTVMILSGGQYAVAFPSSGGWTSDVVANEPNCTFTTGQLDNLLTLMNTSSQALIDLNSGIQTLSESSRPSDRCERYFWDIGTGLAKIVQGAILISENGVNTTTSAEKLKALQQDCERGKREMKKLMAQHSQELVSIRGDYIQQLQILWSMVTRLLGKLDAQAQFLYDQTVKVVVFKLKYESVEKAVSEMDYFFTNTPTIAGDMLKRVVKQMWFSDMSYFTKTMGFIRRLPSHSALGGYSQLVDNMKPLTARDASSLLVLAYKIKVHSTGTKARLGKSILNQFPTAIKQLMRQTSCQIKNIESGHYMKVVSSDDSYYMVGETSAQGGNNRWKLVPFQDSEDSPIQFRILNNGSGKYISDDQGDFELTSTSDYSKWEIKFAANRVQSQSARSPGYLFSPSSSRYLYEAQRSWEPWRCGMNQFLDCAVLTSEDQMYDEGKWIFRCFEEVIAKFNKFSLQKY